VEVKSIPRPFRRGRELPPEPESDAAAPHAPAPAGNDGDPRLRWARGLVWLFFGLLLVEGSLRKWLLPGLSTPLLLIRDPVVLGIYALAWSAGVVPRNGFLLGLAGLALLSVPVGLLQMAAGMTTLPVLLYGLRTNFLYLPLIFVLPAIFRRADVVSLGRWVLLLALPMAVLMFLQFSVPPTHRLNAAIGDGLQISSTMGRVRPAATFSFISGPIAFFALVTAFLTLGFYARGSYSLRMTSCAGAGLAVALAVSGSRSALVSTVLVFVAFLVGLIATGQAGRVVATVTKLAVVGLVLGVALLQSGVLKEGIEVFTLRWAQASEFESESGGMVGRILGEVLGPFRQMIELPVLGLGLGRGTNVGAALLGSPGAFLLAEGEWGRVLLENGPFLGPMVLGYRVVLVAWMAVTALRASRRGELLPLLLFAACGTLLFNGPFGQPTTLGFATLVAGLSLASLDRAGASEDPVPAPAAPPPPVEPPPPRRAFRKPARKVAAGQPPSAA